MFWLLLSDALAKLTPANVESGLFLDATKRVYRLRSFTTGIELNSRHPKQETTNGYSGSRGPRSGKSLARAKEKAAQVAALDAAANSRSECLACAIHDARFRNRYLANGRTAQKSFLELYPACRRLGLATLAVTDKRCCGTVGTVKQH